MTALGNIATAPYAYDAKIVIYVEGQDDVEILKVEWFAEDTNVDFQFVGGTKNQGGCRRVVDVVNGRAKPIPSASHKVNSFDPAAPPDPAPKFGLVDRDYLYFGMSSPALSIFFEPNDSVFHQACLNDQHLGPNVRVLRRWEIENYLVAHARVVSEVLRNANFGDNAYVSYDESKAANELVRHGQALIPIVAANLVRHTHKLPALDERFGVDSHDRCRVENAVNDKLAAEIAKDATLRDEFDAHVASIERFDDPSAHLSSVSRWERLSRMVDGKRMLARLGNAHRVKELRGHLAAKVKARGLVDKEFHDHIAHFRRIAAL
jgi:hypothetical protein